MSGWLNVQILIADIVTRSAPLCYLPPIDIRLTPLGAFLGSSANVGSDGGRDPR